MANNVLTVLEYANIRGCSAKNVYNQIYAGRALEGISSYEKRGTTYFLYATNAFKKANPKIFFKIIENKFGLQL